MEPDTHSACLAHTPKVSTDYNQNQGQGNSSQSQGSQSQGNDLRLRDVIVTVPDLIIPLQSDYKSVSSCSEEGRSVGVDSGIIDSGIKGSIMISAEVVA